jgi:hypothetical protein
MATNASFSPSAGLSAIARGASGAQVDGEMLKVIAVFCGLVLVVLLLFAAVDLEMSIGFF